MPGRPVYANSLPLTGLLRGLVVGPQCLNSALAGKLAKRFCQRAKFCRCRSGSRAETGRAGVHHRCRTRRETASPRERSLIKSPPGSSAPKAPYRSSPCQSGLSTSQAGKLQPVACKIGQVLERCRGPQLAHQPLPRSGIPGPAEPAAGCAGALRSRASKPSQGLSRLPADASRGSQQLGTSAGWRPSTRAGRRCR